MNSYVPSPESLGRKRFPDNQGFRKQLYAASQDYLSQIRRLLPSNYPNDLSTNLSVFNRTWARELARLNLSNNAINADKQYTETRPQYLQEILGERLLLGSNIAPANYNDETYRNYLISIKNAYLIGSKLSNIENLASQFTGENVNIKELYLEAKEPSSGLDVTAANKMIVQVFVDDMLKNGYNINTLKHDLDFFINLVRPAHVLYDTELIWNELININKVHDIIFGDTGGGCVPDYTYTPFQESTVLALQVTVLPNSQGATGVIDSIHHQDLIFYLQDGTRVITEPGTDGTQFFDVNGRRGTFNTLIIGQYVRVIYQVIPGDFDFWYYPSLILPNWQSRFYRSTYRLPLFQETVKKNMTYRGKSAGRFPLQTRTTPTTMCDRWVQDGLQPYYEDLRGTCSGGTNQDDLEITLSTRMGSPNFSWSMQEDVRDPLLFGDNYIHFAEHTPLTDGSSNPATVSDVAVTFDGTGMSGALLSVDASSGRLTLVDSTSYWDASARRPITGDEFIFAYHYLDGTTNFDSTSSMVFGISHWQTTHAPLVVGDGTQTMADVTNVGFSVNGTDISGAVVGLDPLLGHVTLNSSGDFWRSSALGRLPVAMYSQQTTTTSSTYLADSTGPQALVVDPGKLFFPNQSILFTSSFDGLYGRMEGSVVSYDSSNLTVNITDSTHSDGTVLSNWKIFAGDVFDFDYYWGVKLTYGLFFDELDRILDGVIGSRQVYGCVMDGDSSANHPTIDTTTVATVFHVSGIAPDATNPASPFDYTWELEYGPVVSGTLSVAVDGTAVSAIQSFDPVSGRLVLNSDPAFWTAALGKVPTTEDSLTIRYSYIQNIEEPDDTFTTLMGEPEKIGYRYRMYQLHHTSVLNSPDTLLLNNYQKPATKASIINQQSALNHFNEVWSAEFLTDTNPVPELSDAYLVNGLTPVVQLGPGTPTFQQTFSYQPGLIYQDKLQDIRQNHRLLMYSDLLQKESIVSGDPDVPLSSICDGEKFGVETMMKEQIPEIEECESWALFDTIKTVDTEIDIPGEFRGIPNLRIEDKKLENNFILREIEPTGVAVTSYSVHTSAAIHDSTFNLPASFQYPYNDETIDFPALPIVDSTGGYATAADITVTVNGQPWTANFLDPITGVISIPDMPFVQEIEHEFVITSFMAGAKELLLPGAPLNPGTVTLTVVHGTAQYFMQDFVIYGAHLSWLGTPLDGLMAAGDVVRVTYVVDPLLNADIEFTYRIRSSAHIPILDRDWSRIMDDQYVFPGFCPDGQDMLGGMKFDEFYGMLDDASDGIKLTFLNTNTLQVEEHVFSGPIFEYYEAKKDEIGAPDNFPNALIRINNPVSVSNPLNYNASYGFMNDKLVRFRKKTFKELLPNRTFRTMQLTEMLPV